MFGNMPSKKTTIAAVLCVVSFATLLNAADTIDKDLSASILDIFGNGSTTVETKNPDVPISGGDNINTGECTCVPYYLCKDNKIITTGETLIDIRIKDTGCDSYLDLCCNAPSVTDKPIPPATSTEKPHTAGCGQRNPNGIGFRITGDKDNEAQFGEFPWMVAILREEAIEGSSQKLNVYQCGGALIHPKAVVTAAHCVSGKDKQFKIRAGEWDTQTKKELFPHQDRDVASITIHPQYYAGALFNDIAVLILKEPVDIAENIDVICLPAQDTVFEDTRCFASGWGKDVFGKEGKYQVILKKVELPIVQRHLCQDQLRKTRLGKFFDLHESFICAGGEKGIDVCRGDGGSPLVCPVQGHPGRYVHAGIVAWGIGCGEHQVPGVYVNVAKFRKWIDEQISYHNLDSSVYNI